MTFEERFSRSEPEGVRRHEIDAHIWFRGRTDSEAADYVQGMVEREGLVEFWAPGRTEIREMKRAGKLLELRGLWPMYLFNPDPRAKFGMRVAPSLYDFKGSTPARRRD